ncbi:MAG: SAP domain-containing protein, partial [Oscillospiraceae bacterium]|nr:SAP domain-containing protein [Oscillospiraceae bacterium]
MGLLDFFKPKTNANHLPTEPNVTVNIQITKPDKSPIIPLEERIKNVYPSANGLYPHEILMLYYANTYKTENNSFQRFWEYDYSVFEPQKVLDSLFKRGFICVADISVVLKKISVPELKEFLKKAECKTSGKKDELIIRILDKYSKEDLEKIFPVKYYALTSLGENELQQNEYVVYLHKHHYMSVCDMNIALNKSNFDHKLYRDIIWGHFNQQIMEYYKNTDFGLYRNIRLDMYNFLVEENRYKDAFWHLTEVASYDLSGLGNGFANILSLTD